MPEGRDVEVLKTSYRKLAMKFHPDRNPGDATAEVKFKEINEAYDVLKDDQKRAAYDRFGHAAFEGGMGAAGARRIRWRFRRQLLATCSRIFSAIDGRSAGRRRSNRGQDLRYNLEITLEEAFTRPQRRNQSAHHGLLRRLLTAPARKRASSPETCPTCAGHGKVRATQGFFTIERSCSRLPRQRQDHPPSLQDLPRRGPGAEGAGAECRCAAGRRGRHPHPPVGRGRGRRQWRPQWRSLYFPVGGRARHLPARRP